MNDPEYQNLTYQLLIRCFPQVQVEKEWDAAKNSADSYGRTLYCPRLDIAVGPFNIDGNIEKNNLNINRSLAANGNFVQALLNASEIPVSKNEYLQSLNENPRCFLAIEIEKSGSRKHMLGDVVNASILGKIGLVIPMTESKRRGFLGIKKFIEFAMAVKKLKANLGQNVLIIRSERFLDVLNRAMC